MGTGMSRELGIWSVAEEVSGPIGHEGSGWEVVGGEDHEPREQAEESVWGSGLG